MASGPHFQSFLFDLDGTLIDHFTAIHRSYVHTMTAMGLPAPTPGQVRAAVGGGIENAIAKFVPAGRLDEALAIYRPYWDRTMLDDVVLMPGARELLRALHAGGFPLGVITNKLGTSARLICEHLQLTPLLRMVVGAKDTPWLKPQPEFTAYALQQMGVPREGGLLVGDSPYDVDAAHQGGLVAWCVTTGTHTAEALRAGRADAVFSDLAALQSALRI
jgi:phosphoglycolate phosphatase-like HAD superfamily hydrolase